MAEIKILSDRIIIDGHANTREQCETATMLANLLLAQGSGFNCVDYRSGYAEFKKSDVAMLADSELKFPAPPPMDIYVNGEKYSIRADSTWENAAQNNLDIYTISGNTVVWNDGTILQYNGVDVLPADPVHADGQYTTRALTNRKSVDLNTLSGWANLSDGNHTIKIVAKADGYKDSALSAGVTVAKAPQVYTDCLTFTGETSEFTLKATNKTWDGTLEWSTDHTSWTTLSGTEAMQSANKKLYLRGKSNTTFSYYSYTFVKWVLSEKARCDGNIQTLLDYDKPSWPNINSEWCYASMFDGCTNLTSPPELPATYLQPYCYRNMFYNCTSLTSAPELPATTLKDACYYQMFYNCTSLTSAPELPATTLKDWCYEYMFYGCTSLTSAPWLPATKLQKYCYYGMFENCTKLKVSKTQGHLIFTCPSTIPDKAVTDMFANTGGTFTGTPTAGTTYYYYTL